MSEVPLYRADADPPTDPGCRGISFIGNRHSPKDHYKALGIGIL